MFRSVQLSSADEQEILRAIGQNVRRWRKAAGLTQVQLGDALGVVHSTIANLEAGRRAVSAAFLVRLALHLEVHPVVLVTTERPGLTSADALASLARGLR